MTPCEAFLNITAWYSKYYNEETQSHEYPLRNNLLDEIFAHYKNLNFDLPGWESTVHRLEMLMKEYDIEVAIEQLT